MFRMAKRFAMVMSKGVDLGLALCVAAEFALLALQTLSIKLT